MSISNSLLSRIVSPRKIKVLGLKLKRSPNCLRLQRIQPAEGTRVDFEKWKRVKLDVLEGAFKSSPGCFVAHTRLGVYMQDFKRDRSMRVQYTFKWDLDNKSKMYLVHKDEWSRAELDAIATESVCFSSNKLWMMPNTDGKMSSNEAKQVGTFLRKLSSLNFDSEFLDERKWETIGCTYDKEMTWTHPSLDRADLVVDNLKKLCSKLEIELEEM